MSKYAHFTKVIVRVETLRWARIDVDGKPHPHSFWRDGQEKRTVAVEVDKGKEGVLVKAEGGIADLLGTSDVRILGLFLYSIVRVFLESASTRRPKKRAVLNLA